MKEIVLLGMFTSCVMLACGEADEPDAPSDTGGRDAPASDDGPAADDWCARSPELCERPRPDPCDMDGDGTRAPECGGPDCDDRDPGSYPGASDYPCDGVDQDCSGRDYCQPDADGDGWPACEPGETGMGCDCNDSDPAINPGTSDIPCDGIDQNCSGFDGCERPDEDGDGLGACTPGAPATCDCDDANSAIHWGAPETACDGVDQDCSGADCCDQDDDMDGHACRDDCDDADQDVYPGACGPGGTWPPKDFNCDGTLDERDSCDGSPPAAG